MYARPCLVLVKGVWPQAENQRAAVGGSAGSWVGREFLHRFRISVQRAAFARNTGCRGPQPFRSERACDTAGGKSIKGTYSRAAQLSTAPVTLLSEFNHISERFVSGVRELTNQASEFAGEGRRDIPGTHLNRYGWALPCAAEGNCIGCVLMEGFMRGQ